MRHRIAWFSLMGICWVLLSVHQLQAQTVQVKNLRCESLVNPMGIDLTQPRLSWNLASSARNVLQNGYEILVASSKEKLAQNQGDLWTSGKIASGASIQIPYQGAALSTNQQYFWKVRTYTNQGTSAWSEPAYWTMGLLNNTDWKAQWIGWDAPFAWDSITQFSRLSARYLRKEFKANKPIKKAIIQISGLGLYDLQINGKKTGDQVLAPAATDYRKTFFYNSYDVSAQLKQGDNAIGVVLGNGRYFTMRQDYKPKKINNFGFPKLLLQLNITYQDGSQELIVSDKSWKLTADGPIRTNNEYDGEEYDANKELNAWSVTGFNDKHWLPVQLVEKPEGQLVAQMQEPIKIMRKVQPIAIQPLKDKPGVFILDMGQNMVGWLSLQIRGGIKGKSVKLRFAESLEKDGSLYTAHLRDAKATDLYTMKGAAQESWQPLFSFHGFRYVEVTGYPGQPTLKDFEGLVIYDNLANTGSFISSNATLNQIHKNAWWGIAGNYKGMPIDCPQRNERQPWLGDRTMGALGESFLFGNANLYAKWLNDIQDAQTEEGVIPDVAPAFWNYYTDDITWPAAYITVADMLYQQYGDQRSIEKHYASMIKWSNHIAEKYLKKGLITKDKYGDWCVPPESPELIHAKDTARITDGGLIATAYYAKLLQYLTKFAGILGKPADAAKMQSLHATIQSAFNQNYYNKEKKYYGNNTVTANLLPISFGLVPDADAAAVFNQIVTKILVENHGHISTGLIGSQWLMRGLTQHDRADIAYQLATTRTYPGWGYMVAQGATTIWELWNGNTANPQMNSQNHVMLLGDLLTWIYEDLGGIKSDEQAVAFKQIVMKPSLVDGLDWVKASYQSAYGPIASQWKNSMDQFEWNIQIPANTAATIYLPTTDATTIFEGGKLVKNVAGVQLLKTANGFAELKIGSGNYQFLVKKSFKKGLVKNEFIFTEASFPESHASTIAETPKGLVAAWFGGTKEGNKDVCIWVSHLKNGQWTAPLKVADGRLNDSTRYACYNPVLFQVPGGDLLLFYKIGPNVAGWTGWMMRSKDHGQTWSNREALPDGFLGPIKNKPVLINGVLVCPSSTEKTGWKVHFEYTKDWGKTWTKSIDINDGKTITAIQPSILQYKDGSLQVLCRSKNRTINESWSKDGGATWSAMKATALPNNNSGTDAVTLADGRQLLVYNHVKPAANLANGKGARTPLNVAISDDGIHWKAVAVLEDSPISQYSYPSVIQTKDGLVHIVYTWRRQTIKHAVIDLKAIETKSIENETWPGIKLDPNAKPSED